MLLLRVTCVGLAITCILSCFHVRVVKALRVRWFAADVAAFVYSSYLFVYFLLGRKRS